MSIIQAENDKLKAEVAILTAREAELQAAFLKNTTKLGTICAAAGISAGLKPDDFNAAVASRFNETRPASA